MNTEEQMDQDGLAAVTILERKLQVLNNTFEQWVKRCAGKSGLSPFSTIEIHILHRIGRAESPRRIADLCFALKVEDTHIVTYAVRKLAKAGLIEGNKSGKEVYFHTTTEGNDRIAAYAETKRENLGAALRMFQEQDIQLYALGEQLQVLSAVYESAARRAELEE